MTCNVLFFLCLQILIDFLKWGNLAQLNCPVGLLFHYTYILCLHSSASQVSKALLNQHCFFTRPSCGLTQTEPSAYGNWMLSRTEASENPLSVFAFPLMFVPTDWNGKTLGSPESYTISKRIQRWGSGLASKWLPWSLASATWDLNNQMTSPLHGPVSPVQQRCQWWQ